MFGLNLVSKRNERCLWNESNNENAILENNLLLRMHFRQAKNKTDDSKEEQ